MVKPKASTWPSPSASYCSNASASWRSARPSARRRCATRAHSGGEGETSEFRVVAIDGPPCILGGHASNFLAAVGPRALVVCKLHRLARRRDQAQRRRSL